jgi:hypothetical protein
MFSLFVEDEQLSSATQFLVVNDGSATVEFSVFCSVVPDEW